MNRKPNKCFNPTLVRLKEVEQLFKEWIYICFNPTLVRLKEAGGTETHKPGAWFQSHTGSIKSRQTCFHATKQKGFQSHTGSIKSRADKLLFPVGHLFQSHTGSIKRKAGPHP